MSPLTRVRADAAALAAAWDRFWLEPRGPETVGVLRLLIGGMALYSLAVWTPRLDEFFGPRGFQPPEVVARYSVEARAYSVWWLVPDALRDAFHWVCLSVLACYAAGLATPVVKWLTPAIVISYAQRAPAATFGLDQIVGFVTLYLAVSPCGRSASLDAVIARRRNRPPRVTPSVGAGLATRLIQFQLCVIYLYAGLAKLKGEAWWDGTAVWRAIANAEYRSLDLTWLAWHPRVFEAATHATVAWELSFWTLVWNRRLRPYVLAVGAAMHLGIGAFLGMWTFGLAAVFAYAAFVPPASWRRLTASARSVFVGRSEWQDAVMALPAAEHRVLFVDPCGGGRATAVSVLSRRGYDVTPASDWAEACGLRRIVPAGVLVVNAAGMTVRERVSVGRDLAADAETRRVLVDVPTAGGARTTLLASPATLRDVRRAIERLLMNDVPNGPDDEAK